MFELNKQAKQKATVFLNNEELPFCCGVDDVGGFEFVKAEYSWEKGQYPLGELISSGTGLFTASFVNNKECEEAYKQLCSTHKLLYQSPKKRNRNSNRDVFLCVFLHKDRK